ncbi:MAG: Uridine kinase [uncultured Acidimicrobiales bacterium]|uniref:Uridine kinase n=1 Tax=uncultured Acidimicrobiales bacterium TaxID=310071 RepID=A0A6J4HFL3_9ACTN|nr:MAG: Uridine kinase [uncultured Acidimicrobiales bacterium]
MAEARVELSVSTWQQPLPPPASPERSRVLDLVVSLIEDIGPQRLRVVVDGLTAAGKTSLGHELAVGLAARGRPTFRASMDDFKRPWRDAHLYDRKSGEGYYRNAFDLAGARRLLLEPAAAAGDGVVALCSIDPLTQVDHAGVKVEMPEDGVLVVDGVFGCRPEINDCWDLRVWVEVAVELSVLRGTRRDADREGAAEAERLHRDRYLAAELIYLEEVDPLSFVEVVLDNSDFHRPALIRPRG